jgi:hypothetical protein
MSDKVGRPPKHWAEKARAWTWYQSVKQRGWNDSQLNKEFALSAEEKSERNSALDIPRIFDRVRTRGKVSSHGTHWQSTQELINAVDQHPHFKGTKRLYEAEIWDIFQEETSASEVVEGRLDRIFKTYSLTRVNPSLSEELSEEYLLVGPEQLFKWCLNISLKHVDDLNQIVLMWTLYQQSVQARNGKISEVLEEKIDAWLDVFFYTNLRDHYQNFYTQACHAFLSWQPKLSSFDDTLGEKRAEAGWPVVPIELAKELSPNTEWF